MVDGDGPSIFRVIDPYPEEFCPESRLVLEMLDNIGGESEPTVASLDLRDCSEDPNVCTCVDHQQHLECAYTTVDTVSRTCCRVLYAIRQATHNTV